MRTSREQTRRMLATQGFHDVPEADLYEVDLGSRVAPAIGAVWTAVATAMGSPTAVALLVPLAVLGAVTRSHPFDLIYNYGLRFLSGASRLPAYGAPRRVAMGVAAVWLSGTAIAFSVGATGLATAFGVLMVATSVEAASTGFCVVAQLWNLMVDAAAPRSKATAA